MALAGGAGLPPSDGASVAQSAGRGGRWAAGLSAWVSWAERACWAAREEGLGGSRGRPGWGAGRREREKGGKGLGCLSGFRAGSGWLVGFGFSIFLLFSNSSP